jgi:hypothetical protein
MWPSVIAGGVEVEPIPQWATLVIGFTITAKQGGDEE